MDQSFIPLEGFKITLLEEEIHEGPDEYGVIKDVKPEHAIA
jgi:hypothetical protein